MTDVQIGRLFESVRTTVPLDAAGFDTIYDLMRALITVITPTTNVRIVRSELGVVENFVPILGTIAPNLGTCGTSSLTPLLSFPFLLLHKDMAF